MLEAMLKYPEFIPDSWGGESAILKWKEMKEIDVRRREADIKEMAETERKEKEKVEKNKMEMTEKIKKKDEDEKAKKEKERIDKEEKIKVG